MATSTLAYPPPERRRFPGLPEIATGVNQPYCPGCYGMEETGGKHMNNHDGRIAAVATGAFAHEVGDGQPQYAWHVMQQSGADLHALTMGDPYPIIVATVTPQQNGRWLVTAHRHLDPARHQRAHARTLTQARKIAETLTNSECARLGNLRK